jgi:uncharacterized protein (DUF1015 family)
MAVVRAVPALRYDVARVGDLSSVIAPPYDVITPDEQGALYARSPHNVIRLILPREAARAEAAARTLGEWIAGGILVRDPEPAMFLYAQTFTLPDGSSRTREGVLLSLALEEFSRGVVLPHEKTLPGPKADRLAIIRATGANLSPIFGLYARRGERARDVLGVSGPPLVEATDAAGSHRLWRVTDAAAIARFAASLADERIIIADGHHRYETALAYRDEQRTPAAGSILAYVTNLDEEGVVVLPTHRMLRAPLRMDTATLASRLADCFTIERLPPGRPRVAGEIDCILPDRRLRLRATSAAAACVSKLPPAIRSLDVSVLHGAILAPLLGVDAETLEFTHDDEEALDAVTTGHATAAFLLNPPSLAAVRAVCLAGELMPEKSTYFYPKLATGLVFQPVGPPWV